MVGDNYTGTIYSHPENFGLTIIGSHDRADSYEFDIIAVWRDSDGNAFAGRDVGCSCAYPFEDANTPIQRVVINATADFDENNPNGFAWVKNRAELVAYARGQWLRHYRMFDQVWPEDEVDAAVERDVACLIEAVGDRL